MTNVDQKTRDIIQDFKRENHKMEILTKSDYIIDHLAFIGVKVNSNGYNGKMYIIAMESLDMDLGSYLFKLEHVYHRTLPFNDIIFIARDLLLGVKDMHDQSMAHFDIKLGNTLVALDTKSNGKKIMKIKKCKLCDFGGSRTFRDKTKSMYAAWFKAYTMPYCGMSHYAVVAFAFLFVSILFFFVQFLFFLDVFVSAFILYVPYNVLIVFFNILL